MDLYIDSLRTLIKLLSMICLNTKAMIATDKTITVMDIA